MGDLSEIDSSGSTKIVGSSSSGDELTPIKSTGSGELRTTDIDNGNYLSLRVTITDTASILKVGASNLTNRKKIILVNTGNQTAYLGPSTVTDNTTANEGIPLGPDDIWIDEIGENINLYAVCETGKSTSIIVQERSGE